MVILLLTINDTLFSGQYLIQETLSIQTDFSGNSWDKKSDNSFLKLFLISNVDNVESSLARIIHPEQNSTLIDIIITSSLEWRLESKDIDTKHFRKLHSHHKDHRLCS